MHTLIFPHFIFFYMRNSKYRIFCRLSSQNVTRGYMRSASTRTARVLGSESYASNESWSVLFLSITSLTPLYEASSSLGLVARRQAAASVPAVVSCPAKKMIQVFPI
ncbi:hypothetical protein CPB86DRAFT_401912 [Serendipita vermifera]|nr:hypothetical protein CPB86DRAFT_401912 [Serendipita vermifera]